VVKQAGCEADHSPQSSADAIPPFPVYAFVVCTRTTLPVYHLLLLVAIMWGV
jgi:hypothetical protein